MYYEIFISTEYGQIKFLKEYPDDFKCGDVIKEFEYIIGKPSVLLQKQELQMELVQQTTRPNLKRFIYKDLQSGKFIERNIDVNDPHCPIHDIRLGLPRKDPKFGQLSVYCEKCKEEAVNNKGYYNLSKYEKE